MEKLAALCLTFSHAALFSPASTGYEINNHADMSQRASEIGFPISGTNDKLFRLGLRRLAISDPRQTFALGAGLPPIPYCFGEFLPGGSFREYELTTAGGRVQDPAVVQPTGSKLTIAQLFRYGACFEDSETPDKKPLALFYNPPDAGRGLSFGLVVPGPSSLDWTLTRNATPSGNTGINHFTYMDARDFFYKAITQPTTIACKRMRSSWEQRPATIVFRCDRPFSIPISAGGWNELMSFHFCVILLLTLPTHQH